MTDQAQDKPAAKKQKILQIVPSPFMALLKFQWVGGGELPPRLSGTYTSAKAAKEAALAYYAEKGEVVEIETPLESKGKSETRRAVHREIQPI